LRKKEEASKLSPEQENILIDEMAAVFATGD
jgi:hypothetical protein